MAIGQASLLLLLGLNLLGKDSIRVGRVRIVGNRTLPSTKFKLATRPGVILSDSLLAADREAIAYAYAEQGFLQASVESEVREPSGRRSGVRDIVFQVGEGPRAELGKIRISGNRMIATRRLLEELPCRAGPYTLAGVDANARALLRFYCDNGYPFCTVRPESLRVDSNRVSYVLAISEGREVRLSHVGFTGQYRTQPRILAQMLKLKLDMPYSETEVRQGIERLNRDMMVEVKGFEIRRSRNEDWLEVQVQERSSDAIGGAVAYSAQDHELMGNASVGLGNLFGTRRALHLNWQRAFGRQDLALGYTEPWIMNQDLTLTASASNRTRDTSYSQTVLGLVGRVGWGVGAGVELEGSYDFVAATGPELPSCRTLWAGSAAELERRDGQLNPSRGYQIRVGSQAGRRTITQKSRLLVRSQLDANLTVPLGGDWNVTLGFRARDIRSNETLYAYDRFELGGSSSLRGYREGHVLTRQYLLLDVEPRLRLSRSGRAYPFLDLALAQDDRKAGPAYRLYCGYGVGLRIESRLGVLGVDYGLAQGTSPWRGKVHFSVQSEFQ